MHLTLNELVTTNNLSDDCSEKRGVRWNMSICSADVHLRSNDDCDHCVVRASHSLDVVAPSFLASNADDDHEKLIILVSHIL